MERISESPPSVIYPLAQGPAGGIIGGAGYIGIGPIGPASDLGEFQSHLERRRDRWACQRLIPSTRISSIIDLYDAADVTNRRAYGKSIFCVLNAHVQIFALIF